MRNIIFPAYPHSPKEANSFFQKEVDAARKVGFGISLISDEQTYGPITISNTTADFYIYRGWIVKPSYYQEMCQLLNKPILNTYKNYMSSYEFPSWYASFSDDDTPESFIIPAETIVKDGLERVSQMVVDYFRSSEPLVMKDYLKSLKHNWYDAAFIKNAGDCKEIIRIMTNFFELRGRDFVGGLVFRKFLDLQLAGVHPKTKVTVPIEYRTFFLHQKPISTFTVWENEGVSYGSEASPPPQEWLEKIGQKLISPFVGLDLVKDKSNKWWMIEVNDGGSAGVPEYMDLEEFYKQLYLNSH